MSTSTLGYPAQLSRELWSYLPGDRYGDKPHPPAVVPLDEDERKCAAWKADHYWIACCYVITEREAIPALEEALAVIPGVYRTTQVYDNKPADPDWPMSRVRYLDTYHRPQVWALMRDPAATRS
jgi:hypothetical protein